MLKKVYKELFKLPGVSGYEKNVKKYMNHHMLKYNNFTIESDHLGSIFAVKKTRSDSSLVVMVAGHMDEVGLIVVGITNLGMLKLQPIGGLAGEILVSQVLNVHTKKGVIKGVVGGIPPHFRIGQITDIDQLVLDIGASSKQEAITFGVALGDMVVFENTFAYTKNPNRIISKAVDNRFGCGLALETISKFNNIELPFTLVVGATVQEEIGLRGAETAVNYFNPDVFIALDASPINDAIDRMSLAGLGKGFLLRIYDPRNLMHQGLLEYFVSVAKRNKIDHQFFTSKGGTDAAKALDLKRGVLATTIGLPARYIHTTAAMMDVKDLNSARKMLFKVIKDITMEKVEKIRNSNR